MCEYWLDRGLDIIRISSPDVVRNAWKYRGGLLMADSTLIEMLLVHCSLFFFDNADAR